MLFIALLFISVGYNVADNKWFTDYSEQYW